MDGKGGECGTAGHQLIPGTRRCEVCGKDLAVRFDGGSLAASSDRSDFPTGRFGQGSRYRVSERVAVLGAVALVAAGALLASADDRDWPQQCGVDGRAEWCAEPSAVMTEPAMASLVRDYCPKLADVALRDVVPQPLSQLDLASKRALAKTSGSDGEGTEDVLLGQPGRVAWITRSVGGEADGRVEVRCYGDAQSTASLRLQADQFRSTVAAASAADARRIDFTEVAREALPARSGTGLSRRSYGFITCDTTGIDLDHPATGRTFFCVTEVYGLPGRGELRSIYQVAAERPYFESLPVGYDCTSYATASPSPAPVPASGGTKFDTTRCSTWRFSHP